MNTTEEKPIELTSLAAITRISNASTGLVDMKTYIRSCLVLLMTSLPLLAIANPCDDGGIGGTGIALSQGIGGTGITARSGGLGGTGITTTQKGIGGTGITNTQKGIGGTGVQAKSGIGGTGIQAQSGIGGTGIVGMITGFGSICVNGLEVHYFSNTPVDLDGKQISSQSLAIGQFVAVKATGNEQSLIADEIHAYHQITGPITAVDTASGTLKVMGQTVIANGVELNGMQIGNWVEVSGLRKDDGSVVASRIDLTTSQKNVQLVGNLTRRGNNLYLGNTKIEGLPKTAGTTNTDTRLTGVWNGNSLYVKDMTLGPVSELLEKVELFYLQGLASSNPTNGQLKLAGQHVLVTGQTQVISNDSSKNLAGRAVIVRGQMKDGKPTAETIELKQIKPDFKKQHDSQQEAAHTKTSNETGEKTSSKESREHDSIRSETKNGMTKFEKSEKHEKIDKIEKIDIPEKIEKIDKIERIDIPEKIEKIDKIERIDIPAKLERLETLEKVH